MTSHHDQIDVLLFRQPQDCLGRSPSSSWCVQAIVGSFGITSSKVRRTPGFSVKGIG